MLQSLLTASIDFVFIAFAVHSVIFLVAGLPLRRSAATAPTLPVFDLEDPELAEFIERHWHSAPEADSFTPTLSAPLPGSRYATPEESALVEAASASIATYWANYALDNVVPFKRPRRSIDWSGFTTAQLRQECSKRGIRWNRANDGKHLTKPMMIERLQSA